MNLDYRQLIALGTAFIIIVTGAYLIGYWGSFHVNVFEYIGLSDIAKTAIYPLLATILSGLAGVLLGHFIFTHDNLPPGGGSATKFGRFLNRHWRLLIALHILLILLIVSIGKNPQRWMAAGMLIGLFAAPLSRLEFLIKIIPEQRLRSGVLFYILFLPCASFSIGRIQAHSIKTDHPPDIVDTARSKLPFKEDKKHPVAFLGHLGEYNIFYETLSHEISYIKQKDGKPLFIIHKNYSKSKKQTDIEKINT